MRVRNLAVVGAALVAAWAGGTGVAQATPEGGELPSCTDLYASAVVVDEDAPVIDPCLELPDDCEFLPLSAVEGTNESGEAVHPDFPCGDDITIHVTGDCKDPETFTFIVNATDLVPNGKYNALLTSADPESDVEVDDAPVVVVPFVAGADGSVVNFEYTATESADDFDFPAGAFTLYWLAGGDFDGGYLTFGTTDVKACEPVKTDPVVVVPPAAQPAVPVAAPVVAPVAVAPVAAHPAVLANTGSPVTSAALLGGGLLLAGAGAMVATRRRAS